MSFHAAAIQKFEDLAIRLDQSPATARIDLVATVCTEFDPGKDIFGYYMQGFRVGKGLELDK